MFFVTYRLARKDISMEYCPTSDMYRYFYTNPIQGGLYKTKRQAIINLQSNYPDDYGPEGYKPSVSQECVGNNHSNRNEVAGTQTGKLKCVHRSKNTITYLQAVIKNYRGEISDVWDKRQKIV